MKRVWMRVGMIIEVSDEQFAELREEADDNVHYYHDIDAPQWLLDLAKEKGEFDGDAYIPGDVISELVSEDDSCAVTRETIKRIKTFLLDKIATGTPIKECIGFIYGLYQDYSLSEDQEVELYMLVDPDEKWNDCSEYLEEILDKYGSNPLADYLEGCKK